MAYKLIYNPLIDYIRSHVCLCVILLYSKASCLCTVEWYTVACKPNSYQEVCGDLPLSGRMANFAAGMICLHMFSIVTLKIT